MVKVKSSVTVKPLESRVGVVSVTNVKSEVTVAPVDLSVSVSTPYLVVTVNRYPLDKSPSTAESVLTPNLVVTVNSPSDVTSDDIEVPSGFSAVVSMDSTGSSDSSEIEVPSVVSSVVTVELVLDSVEEVVVTVGVVTVGVVTVESVEL